jgi:hypothetical protein
VLVVYSNERLQYACLFGLEVDIRVDLSNDRTCSGITGKQNIAYKFTTTLQFNILDV